MEAADLYSSTETECAGQAQRAAIDATASPAHPTRYTTHLIHCLDAAILATSRQSRIPPRPSIVRPGTWGSIYVPVHSAGRDDFTSRPCRRSRNRVAGKYQNRGCGTYQPGVMIREPPSASDGLRASPGVMINEGSSGSSSATVSCSPRREGEPSIGNSFGTSATSDRKINS